MMSFNIALTARFPLVSSSCKLIVTILDHRCIHLSVIACFETQTWLTRFAHRLVNHPLPPPKCWQLQASKMNIKDCSRRRKKHLLPRHNYRAKWYISVWPIFSSHPRCYFAIVLYRSNWPLPCRWYNISNLLGKPENRIQRPREREREVG